MTNLKTTVAGVVAAIATFSQAFGFEIPAEVTNGIIAVALFFMGLFARDK